MNNYHSFPPNGHYQHPTGPGYSPRTFSQRSPRGFSPNQPHASHGYPGGSSPRHYMFNPSPNYNQFSHPPSPRKAHYSSPAFQGRFTSPNDVNKFRTPSSSQSPAWGRGSGTGRRSFNRQFQPQSPAGIESYYNPGMVDDPWKNCNPVPVTETQAATT